MEDKKLLEAEKLILMLDEILRAIRDDVEKSPSCETQRMALKNISFANVSISTYFRRN